MSTPIPENHASFRLGELALATRGSLVDADAERQVTGVSTDSRSVATGALFVALAGETHDAHRFVPQARERGAVPVVRRGAEISGPRLEVDDTLAALGAIARRFVEREAWSNGRRPVLALAGSAGKTTTKTLAAAAVETLFGPTLVTAGNLNNRIGVPMTLLTLDARHRAIVLECGTSVAGEIAALGAIALPDVALVLNVALEHSERLGDLESIADEECSLFAAARRVAIGNADDPRVVVRLERARIEQRTFGGAESADLRLLAAKALAEGGQSLRFEIGGRLFADRTSRKIQGTAKLVGESAAMNVAAALLGALALLEGPASADDAATALAAIARVEPVAGRLRPIEAGGVLILDDSYNSNPRSAKSGIAAAAAIAGIRRGRLVLALGDMLELGAFAGEAHADVVLTALAARPRAIVLVGPELARAAEAGAPATLRFATSDDAAKEIASLVRPGDVVLVKGSRGMKMERIVEALEAARESS